MRLRGRLGRYGFEVKSYDLGEARATADFAPVYRASEQVPSTRLRELARAALELHAVDVLDPLPAELELPIRRDALAAIHFPADPRRPSGARKRLALDELVALQLAVARSRAAGAVGTPLAEPGRARRPLPGGAAVRSSPSTRSARSREIDARPRRARRCSGCCRATSARARRSSRSTRCCARSRRDGRGR